jgi:hypothetical protein
MAVDERSRRELHERLKEAIDVETADLLLDQLPPPWAEIATKSDIEATKSDIEKVRTRIAEVERALTQRFDAALLVVLAILVPLIVYH